MIQRSRCLLRASPAKNEVSRRERVWKVDNKNNHLKNGISIKVFSKTLLANV